MGVKLIKISVIYFTIGVLLGLYMSMEHNYELKGVHVHINLIGWASFALAGFVYHLFPITTKNLYAKLHFLEWKYWTSINDDCTYCPYFKRQ